MEHCRSCNAKIAWCVTAKNRRMPVDFYPVFNGNIVLTEQEGRPPLATHVKPDPTIKHHTSHFATCPQSKKWKKKEKTDA